MNTNTDMIIDAIDFTPDNEVVDFHGSRPSKETAIRVGWLYTELANDGKDKELDALLASYGPVMIRRSLLAFGNYAARQHWAGVPALARELRNGIKIVAANRKTA